MTDDDINRIQSALGVRLPADYADLLRTHKFSGEQDEHFCLDPDYLIEQNETLRRNGYYGPPWPSHYLWIGDVGGGEVFLLKLNEGGSAVYMCNWNNIQEDDQLPPLDLINETAGEFVQYLDEMPDGR